MNCNDLKVVSLNITEDNYEAKALFRLCTDEVCMDMEVEKLSEPEILEEVKRSFQIIEPIEEMKQIIMDKVVEATKLESRIREGDANSEAVKDKKALRSIDSLSMS